MNRNINIVLVVVILGALFAIGVNSFLRRTEQEQSLRVQGAKNLRNLSGLSHSSGLSRSSGLSGLSGLSSLKTKGYRATTFNYIQRPETYNIKPTTERRFNMTSMHSATYGLQSASALHTSSAAQMHSVGGSGSMVDSRRSGYANYQLAGTGKGSNYAGTNYNSIGSGIYSSTSSLIAGNRTYNDNSANSNYGGSTRAAARRNINYPTFAGNTPQLYDMSAPVGGFNSLIGMNGLSALYSLNGADNHNYTGSTRRFASGLSDDEWRQSYYNKYGSWPTDAQLAAYKELMESGQVTEPSSSDIPTLDDEYWRNMFFMEFGYLPSDEQLEAYIKYKTETGSDTPPSSDIPTLDDDEWANMFFMEFGRFPTPEELEAYKNYKLGVVPVGDGMWLLLLLALVYALRKCFKGLRSLKCVR